MKLVLKSAFAVFAAAVSLLSTNATAALNYSNGDLLLGFRSSADPGSTTDYVVNIGPASQFTTASSTFTVANLGNIAADLVATFSNPGVADWNARAEVSWGIIGTDLPADPANTLYATKSRDKANLGTQTTPYNRASNTTQSTVNSRIRAFVSGYTLSDANAASPKGTLQPTSATNSYYSCTYTGPAFQYFSGFEGNFGAGTAGSVLDLYRLAPTTQNTAGAGQIYVGSFQLDNNGQLTFTPAAAAVPKFSFAASTYSVDEAAGTVTVHVTRSGLTSGTDTVQFDTSDGTALAGADFTAKTGFVVSFAPGVTDVGVTVDILNRPGFQGDRSFNVTLSNSSAGATIIAPSSASVTILESSPAVATITSIAPTHGPASGGTQVIISGTNFVQVSDVRFGLTPAASFTVNSASQITAVSPAGSAGAVDISIVTASGTSANSAADVYTFELAPAPAITALAPTHGPASGGSSVTITGSNFTGATAVKFGVATSGSFSVGSNTQISAVAPAGTPGSTVNVTVITASGTSAIGASSEFTYDAAAVLPGIASISPNHGPADGGTSVLISGSNFSGATSVRFGAIASGSFALISGSQLTAVAPAGTPGSKVNLTVITASGTSAISSAGEFTYDAAPALPEIVFISPSHGSAAGGTSVTISGSNFTGATTVGFGATASGTFAVVSSSQIIATAPAGTPGSKVNVTVITASGTSANSAVGEFTYDTLPVPEPVPGITSISPNSGSATGGVSVTISGSNFTGATSVRFGAIASGTFSVVSSTQVTAVAPAGTAGTKVDVSVVTSTGTSANTSADDFTYLEPDNTAPKLVVTAPKAGPVGASFDVTGFASDSQGISRVEVKLNNGPAQLADLGAFTSGSASFRLHGLAPENGSNTVTIQAVDLQGNKSTLKTIVVRFVNSRPGLAGSYNGLIVSGTGIARSNNLSGFLNLSVTASGLFTGKVTLGGFTLQVSGVFGNDGTARFNPNLQTVLALSGGKKNPVQLGDLSLVLDTGTSGKVTGTLSKADALDAASVQADLAYYDGKTHLVDSDLLKNKGLQTVVFAFNPQASGSATATHPAGYGIGSITLSSKGIATLKATLSDGTKFTAAAPLSKSYEWPLFAQLYKKAGSIAGWVSLGSGTSTTTATGLDLLWFRPAQPGASFYPLGWESGITVDLLGAGYEVPSKISGASVFPGLKPTDPANGNALAEFSGGDLSSLVSKPVNIDSANKVTNTGLAADKSYSLKITAATGALGGFFTHSDGSKPAFNAVIVQHDLDAVDYVLPAGGYGFFIPTVTPGATRPNGTVSVLAR